jgi:mRNA interferase MazF
MKRGEIWTVSAGGYAGKPRPAVVIQDDRFNETMSLTVCIFTTTDRDAPLARVPVMPTVRNGLRQASHLMVDKITTVPKAHVGRLIGQLEDELITQLNRSIFLFLGLAGIGSSEASASAP